jgi:hypothetical protein
MAFVEWCIRADEFVNCNCAYGCPCQFNALPTMASAKPLADTRSMRGISVRFALMGSAQRSALCPLARSDTRG